MATQNLWLELVLESDATFGRGDGLAGVVDEEVRHDNYGLPYLNGKTLKGLLDAECAEIIAALEKVLSTSDLNRWTTTAQNLFGSRGSGHAQIGRMHVGDACLPEDLREHIAAEFQMLDVARRAQRRTQVLDTLTVVRRQTAIDPDTGAPARNTLRSMRVILRETRFIAPLSLELTEDARASALQLLAACVKAFHRAGTGKQRGRGKLRAQLYDYDPLDSEAAKPVTDRLFDEFQTEVRRAGNHVSD